MHEITRLILDKYQARMTKKQKTAFRSMLTKTLAEKGVDVVHETGGTTRPTNMIVGDLSRAEYIFTAHYDTQPELPIPLIMAPMGVGAVISQLYSVGVFVLCMFLLSFLLVTIFPALSGFRLFGPIMSIGFMAMVFFGKPNKHTANDNTSGVCVLVEALLSLPKEARERAAFVFFDQEELGLLGSGYFKKLHGKEIAHTPLINFDCVSDGDVLSFMAHKTLHGDAAQMDKISAAFPTMEGKQARIFKVGKMQYASDQMHFDKGMGVAALRESRVFGLHIRRIHSRFDTQFDARNIAFLRGFIENLLAKDAAN